MSKSIKDNFKALRKEINGKQVVWVDGEREIEVILLSPPKGDEIVVKPYGYTPEELLEIYKDCSYDLETFADPKFCLASFETIDEENLEVAERINEISNGGTLDFLVITKGHEENSTSKPGEQDIIDIITGNPSCPYS